MRVVVIGGGVIGLSCAFALARRGAHVTVVDRGALGGACSFGNLGWIVPSLSEPLPAPGLTGQSIKFMLQRDGPLFIDPRFAISSASWLWNFWRHCNARDYQHGLEAMAALNGTTFALFDALRQDGVDFEMHRNGLLFLFLSREAQTKALAEFERLAALGVASPRNLEQAALHDLQPGLAAEVRGGILIEGEGHVRPETLTRGLAKRLLEMGCQVQGRVEVESLARHGGTIVAARTPHGLIEGDAFVLASGVWSAALAKRMGFSLPIRSGRGYSVTINGPTVTYTRAMYLYEKRVGISPFEGATRIGGTMELSRINAKMRPGRVAAIRRAAARYVPGSEKGGTRTEWSGARPLTPDGLPAIGRAPGFDNVFVATGHAMLGITLAPVTGAAIAELVTGTTSSYDLAPFDPGRFG